MQEEPAPPHDRPNNSHSGQRDGAARQIRPDTSHLGHAVFVLLLWDFSGTFGCINLQGREMLKDDIRWSERYIGHLLQAAGSPGLFRDI